MFPFFILEYLTSSYIFLYFLIFFKSYLFKRVIVLHTFHSRYIFIFSFENPFISFTSGEVLHVSMFLSRVGAFYLPMTLCGIKVLTVKVRMAMDSGLMFLEWRIYGYAAMPVFQTKWIIVAMAAPKMCNLTNQTRRSQNTVPCVSRISRVETKGRGASIAVAAASWLC